MKGLFLALWLAFSIVILTGCSKKVYVPVETSTTITERVRDTIVQVQLKQEYVKQVVPDTTSTVETEYAVSTAVWHGDRGTLEHTIGNKSGTVEVPGKVMERVRVIEKPVPYPVYVDKPVDRPVRMPLRWYERILAYIGIAALGGGVIWIARKVNKFKK